MTKYLMFFSTKIFHETNRFYRPRILFYFLNKELFEVSFVFFHGINMIFMKIIL